MTDLGFWVKCSICGRPIRHGAAYYVCSVAGCNKRKFPFRFHSVDCWDAHRADQNHRSAECVEEQAPDVQEAPRPGSPPGRSGR